MISEAQLSKKIGQKIKSINVNQPVTSLKKYIQLRPVGIKDINLLTEDLKGLQLIVSKLNEKHYSEILKTFTEGQCQIILDYLHRFMQLINQNAQKQNISSGNMLNFEDEIIRFYGPSILIQTSARNDTLCNRTRSYII